MRGRRVTRREAEAVLSAHLAEETFKRPMSAKTRAGRERIAETAAARLNRAQRRALGERGDGRYHPAVARMDVPRSRSTR